MTDRQPGAGVRDFDFLFGTWHIANERLIARLAGSTEWEHFVASGECRPILGGGGNVDSFSAERNGVAFEGASFRLFNPTTGAWSIYWAENVTGTLQPPVVGRFLDGVGKFIGEDHHHGRPVRARFLWSKITADSARWEQAFSTDHGATWETNWIMRFARTGNS